MRYFITVAMRVNSTLGFYSYEVVVSSVEFPQSRCWAGTLGLRPDFGYTSAEPWYRFAASCSTSCSALLLFNFIYSRFWTAALNNENKFQHSVQQVVQVGLHPFLGRGVQPAFQDLAGNSATCWKNILQFCCNVVNVFNVATRLL